jgi:hypothetical protein
LGAFVRFHQVRPESELADELRVHLQNEIQRFPLLVSPAAFFLSQRQRDGLFLETTLSNQVKLRQERHTDLEIGFSND